jgi:hypothetical protein
VLHLSYLADVEDPGLVASRLETLEQTIQSRWPSDGIYELKIESEVFWRLGSPPDRATRRQRSAP